MHLLRDEVLAKALLRRTKQQRAEDLALPPRTTYLRKVRSFLTCSLQEG